MSRSAGAGARKIAWGVIILHLVCVILPILVMVVWAFTAAWAWPDLLPTAFSSRGVAEIFVYSPDLGATLALSIAIALITALLSTIVAAMAARALARYSFRGHSLFQFSLMLPFLIPATVFAMGVQIIFIRLGLSGTVLGVILAHTIVALPYSVMLLTDVTRAAGTKLEEQARTLGANWWQSLIHVQIPQLLPGILSSMSMAYIMSFSQYFMTLLIGGGRVKTFAVSMFPFLASGDRTVAAAYGVVFLAVSLVVFIVFELLVKRHTVKQVEYFK